MQQIRTALPYMLSSNYLLLSTLPACKFGAEHICACSFRSETCMQCNDTLQITLALLVAPLGALF